MKGMSSLAIACAVLCSGCVVTESDEQVLCEGTRTILEDYYAVCGFELKERGDVRITAELVSGPSVEVYLLTESGYQTWSTIANGQYSSATFTYYQEFSQSPLATSFDSGWHGMPEGKYYLLIENTDYGNTMPPFNFINDTAVVVTKVAGRK